MKPRSIGAAVFVAVMLVCGGLVLRQWQVKHPAKPKEASDHDFRNGRERMGSEDWREARPKERAAAIACIDGQLDAFRKDDYVKAISYQSKILHAQFSSPTVFRSMIRGHYPEFANAKKATYGRAYANRSGRMVSIEVALTGADNHLVEAQYRLIQEPAGYRVLGVGGGR